ncbi:capsid protein [Apilactobacillus timberlakei]|uniref:capsid protein n=1 Tax=Apilactobacillus timberlakei TaxID=2008380 RepID=UPI001128AB94|nr:capsid protein [Apilactobacillus timberlakei]TPR21442.1 capsid protein [Apilactobacillus timberlakei]
MLNYAEDYKTAYDEKFRPLLTSSDLWASPSNNTFKFDGTSHIKVPEISVDSGRTDRKRNDLSMGHLADYSNDWTDYKLRFDREWKASVDPRDVDDTKQLTTIGNITGEYNRSQKVPEQDCYMYSELFKQKAASDADGVHTETLDENNVLKAFDGMMERMDNFSVTGERQLYVTPKINKILERANVQNRLASVNGNGNIDRSVYSLDDVTIKVVPASRMKTDFDFSVGVKQKDSAKQIQMFLIVNGVQIAPDKYQFAGLQAPSALTNGNYLYYESEFADVFLLKNKMAGYEVYVEEDNTAKPAGK